MKPRNLPNMLLLVAEESVSVDEDFFNRAELMSSGELGVELFKLGGDCGGRLGLCFTCLWGLQNFLELDFIAIIIGKSKKLSTN